jgi:hypothetical protein
MDWLACVIISVEVSSWDILIRIRKHNDVRLISR